MPAVLRLRELPVAWITKAQYTTARIMERSKEIRIRITSAVPIHCYVLTREGRQEFKKLTDQLIKR